MDYIPEIIAQASFFPSGVFMGYMFYIFEFSPPEALEHVQYWPFMVGIASSAVTALVLTILKVHLKREHFFQFYFLSIGTVVFVISGCLFLSDYGVTAIYIAGIGHGITYVASFSYINIRVSKKRPLRIVVCHCWYFLGCALAADFINTAFVVSLPPIGKLIDQRIGILMTTFSGIIAIMLLVNESLNYNKFYNYKQSLNKEINQSNDVQTLFLSRDELIESLKNTNIPGYNLLVTTHNEKSASFWLLILKLNGCIMFSSIMIYLVGTASFMYNENKGFTLVQCIVFAGSAVGLIVYDFVSTKKIFYSVSVCQIISLIATVVVYSDSDSLMDAAIPLWIFYVFLGLGYCIADLSLLDVSTLKTTETVLAIGYLIEIFPIAVIEYCFFYATDVIVLDDDISTLRAHGISFICAILIFMIVIGFNLPNTYGKSLLQIRNELLGVKYVKQVDIQSFERTYPNAEANPYIIQGLYGQSLVSGQTQQSSSPNQSYAHHGLYRQPNVPQASVGMNNMYSNEFRMLSPGNIMPKAIVGGIIFGSLAI